MKTITSFAVAASLFAGAAQAETLDFTRDGQSYHADVQRKAGETIVRGYNATTGNRFRLRIADGLVRGNYGPVPVNFRTPAQTDALLALR